MEENIILVTPILYDELSLIHLGNNLSQMIFDLN